MVEPMTICLKRDSENDKNDGWLYNK